ncbi:MAG: shikimate kinase [Beutenbergiaceae bacterium]
MTAPQLVLVGLPGAGKSTVGQLLAQTWHVGYRDTDDDIEALTNMSIADIFITEGESKFRELERAAVVRALAEHDGVLALGGGAILDARTRTDLAGHRVVYLRVSLAAASPRIGLSGSRPLLVGSPRKQWLTLADQRKPLYEALATVTVSTDDRSPEQVVQQILTKLEQR